MRSLRANLFEIGYPEGWTDHSTVTLVGPERAIFSPNVTVNQEERPTGMSVDEYVTQQRTELQELEGFRLVDSGERRLGAATARFHSYVWRIPQGVEIRQSQLIADYGGKLYTVTLSSRDDEWELFEPFFDLLVGNFRFL